METDAKAMLSRLSPEIDRKCASIRAARAEGGRRTLFFVLCALAVLLPTVCVFFGVNLAVLRGAIIFTGAAFLLLSPILINQQGGRTHGKVR